MDHEFEIRVHVSAPSQGNVDKSYMLLASRYSGFIHAKRLDDWPTTRHSGEHHDGRRLFDEVSDSVPTALPDGRLEKSIMSTEYSMNGDSQQVKRSRPPAYQDHESKTQGNGCLSSMTIPKLALPTATQLAAADITSQISFSSSESSLQRLTTPLLSGRKRPYDISQYGEDDQLLISPSIQANREGRRQKVLAHAVQPILEASANSAVTSEHSITSHAVRADRTTTFPSDLLVDPQGQVDEHTSSTLPVTYGLSKSNANLSTDASSISISDHGSTAPFSGEVPSRVSSSPRETSSTTQHMVLAVPECMTHRGQPTDLPMVKDSCHILVGSRKSGLAPQNSSGIAVRHEHTSPTISDRSSFQRQAYHGTQSIVDISMFCRGVSVQPHCDSGLHGNPIEPRSQDALGEARPRRGFWEVVNIQSQPPEEPIVAEIEPEVLEALKSFPRELFPAESDRPYIPLRYTTGRSFPVRIQHRAIEDFERGTWTIDVTSWSAKALLDFLQDAQKYIVGRMAGPGTWGCVEFGMDDVPTQIRVFCAQDDMDAVYFGLYILSDRKIGAQEIDWVDWTGRAVVTMGKK